MGGTSKGLTFGSDFIWKNLRNKYPANRALGEGKKSDVEKKKYRYSVPAEILRIKRPGDECQSKDQSDRSDKHQFLSPESVDIIDGKQCKHEVDQTNADGGHQRRIRTHSRHLKNPGSVVDHRVDPRNLIEHGNQNCQQYRKPVLF